MVDKNLFLYNLAVVAIFKNEGRYLKEWLDYHLLAGVDHFYLYNNDSTDDYREVLAPYINGGLVTLTDWSGKLAMYPAYDDAIQRHRFKCRYIAFIDLDEFLYPKSARSVVEVVEEIFSRYPSAAAFGINWQCFGSNGQDKADYSRGLLERFTRRAPHNWIFKDKDDNDGGNIYIKSVVNPRRVDYFLSPHYAAYLGDAKSINSNGKEILYAGSYPVAVDKIVVNHYYTKSREEYETKKLPKGSACLEDNPYVMKYFQIYDRNEEFDDGILRYRADRAGSFAIENDDDKIRRVESVLVETLTQCSPVNAPSEFFKGKLETFLTCRALAELFDIKIGGRSAEEYALAWIYRTLTQEGALTYAEIYQLLKVLPELLARPFPICRKLNLLVQEGLIPSFCEALKNLYDWKARSKMLYIQSLLRLIK